MPSILKFTGLFNVIRSLRSPDYSAGSLPADVPSLIPAGDGPVLKKTSDSNAHSFSLSRSHRPDMTEILLRRTRDITSYPSIRPQDK